MSQLNASNMFLNMTGQNDTKIGYTTTVKDQV